MKYTGSDHLRISAEYERRARDIPADYYSWSKPMNLLFHEHTVRGCIQLLAGAGLYPPRGRRILDVGCGYGGVLLEFLQWGADPAGLCGIDLSTPRVEYARQRVPQADVRSGSASSLPWPDGSFDLVTQFTVFTSILDPALRRSIATEMLRVLKPDGAIFWFDFRFNNPSNSHVRGVPAREVRALFKDCKVQLASVVLAPPLCRLIAGWSRPLAELLHMFPFLRSHYAGLIRRRVRNPETPTKPTEPHP